MAGYRQLHTRMWSSDRWFADLRPEHKLLFVYLFSNERASVSGLYELPLRVMVFETGLDQSVVEAGLADFEKAEKVYYDQASGVVYVRNMFKYQGSGSPKVKERVKADLKAVPDCDLKNRWINENRVSIGYADGKDTSLSISISSSVSSSEEEEGAGGETIEYPETVPQAFEHPDIQLYQQITGRFPGDRNWKPIIDTLQLLRRQRQDLESYLPPYWLAWSTRKAKGGKPYNPSSLVWLCEWALQGSVPSANGHEPQPGETMDDVIKQVIKNAKKR